MEPIAVALILAGVVLAFAGAALFRYTIAIVGFLGGASLGFFAADLVAGGTTVLVGAAVVCGLIGVFAAFSMITTVVTLPGFALGAYVTGKLAGLSAGPSFELAGATFVGGIVGAALAGLAFRKVLPILTAFVGAALATRAVTYEGFVEAVSSVDPSPMLFDPGALFVSVFVAGLLSQYGLLKLGHAKVAAIPVGIVSRRLSDDENRRDNDRDLTT